jgi:hypothetical protein
LLPRHDLDQDGWLLWREHVLLGTATAMAGVRTELIEKKVVTERELKTVAFDGLRPFD